MRSRRAVLKLCTWNKHLLEHQTAWTFKIEVWTDNSSAKAIIQRLGPGRRAKHLEVLTLWVSTDEQARSHLDEQAGYAGKRGRHDDKTCATRSSGQISRNDGLLIPWWRNCKVSIEQSYWNQKLTTMEKLPIFDDGDNDEWSMMFTALWTKRLVSRQPFWGGVLRCRCCDNHNSTDHRDLLSYVTIDWETVWGWHVQIEKCNQVSSWMISVKVVSPCSLTDAVRESSFCCSSLFLLHAWCSGSVRVDCCEWCAVSVCWCTRHVCPLCSRLRPCLLSGSFALSLVYLSPHMNPNKTDCVRVQRSVISIVNRLVRDSSSFITHPKFIVDHTPSTQLSLYLIILFSILMLNDFSKMLAEHELQSTECLERKDRILRELIQLICSCQEGATSSGTPQTSTPSVTRLINTRSLLQVTPYHGDKGKFSYLEMVFLVCSASNQQTTLWKIQESWRQHKSGFPKVPIVHWRSGTFRSGVHTGRRKRP